MLDTWFSSALWPFSTLGWPDETKELEMFYPTGVLSTSFDIIFFWVARMMMMGLKFKGDVPFKDVYIHALIRDAKGQKMSKSKGNVIDPLVMMDKYGTDAFRFTLAVLAAQGRDIRLAEERIGGYRNFCNKIWNVARFTLMNLEGYVDGLDETKFNMADKWIWERRNECIKEVSEAIETYRFDEAGRVLYRFVWHELCDWYVELIKLDLWGERGPERKLCAQQVLMTVMRDVMKLLHPFMPFITEEIAEKLPGYDGSVMLSEFPKEGASFAAEASRMEDAMDVIRAVRNIRTDMNVAPSAVTECVCHVKDAALRASIQESSEYIRQLGRISELVITEGGEKPSDAVSALAGGGESKSIEVFVPLGGLVDFDVEEKRLLKELEKTEAEHAGVAKKLSNPEFTDKAPAEIVEKDRARLEALTEKKAKLATGLERIRSIRQ